MLSLLQGSDAAFSALEDISAVLQQLQGMHKVAAALQQPVTAAIALLEGLLGQEPFAQVCAIHSCRTGGGPEACAGAASGGRPSKHMSCKTCMESL